MKNFPFFTLLVSALVCISCSMPVNKIFGKKTPHETYADKVEDTEQGIQWMAASKNALNDPHTISLPYKQIGYFPADRPRALALEFNATHGERINFELNKKTTNGFVIYADLYQEDGVRVSHLLAPDTSASHFSFDVAKTGNYVLRLQPELNRSGEYSLSVFVAASLGFPVSGNKSRTGSFWGAPRDGGSRSHEGIDIFAPKLTPAIAAADGYVTKVSEEGIGGKTVWLKVNNNNISLYYAHLDKQLVEEGQVVKKGDVVGLVGNTGNAKHTPSHLHFGIYTFGGPVDPWPFVNKAIKMATAVPAKKLPTGLKLIKPHTAGVTEPIKINTLLIPLAVTARGYIAELPGGKIIETNFGSVKTVKPDSQETAAPAATPALTVSGF